MLSDLRQKSRKKWHGTPENINLPKGIDMDNELCRNSEKIKDNSNETGNESLETNRYGFHISN